MDELKRAVEVALTGPQAQKALDEQRRQMDQWGITLPPGPALVLDFGLGRFDEIGEIEHWIANEIEEGYCGKLLYLQDGQTCPEHHHQRKHETFYIVKGTVRMILDGVERTMNEGDVLAVDRGQAHCFAGVGPALILEISQPCLLNDNFFDDQDIKLGRESEGQTQPRPHIALLADGSRRKRRESSSPTPNSASAKDSQ
ncbi:MAG: cupin domain-containing protein [Pirellulales bacterium]|nr:cupin domain-containing protein [Pirellulales bacterium]